MPTLRAVSRSLLQGPLRPDNLSNLSHGQSLRGHFLLRERKFAEAAMVERRPPSLEGDHEAWNQRSRSVERVSETLDSGHCLETRREHDWLDALAPKKRLHVFVDSDVGASEAIDRLLPVGDDKQLAG